MRVVIAGIPKPGLEVDLDLGADWVRDAARDALDAAASSVRGALEVRVQGQRVSVGGRVRAVADGLCDRCGEAVERVVQVEAIALHYLPDRGDLAPDLELGAEDLDVGWYRHGVLDLGDVLREALALAVPARTTCTDTAGCDARTDVLLRREGPDEARSAFAVLRELQ